MADETHLNLKNGNGERLQLQVGNKSLGLSTRDLLPLLLLLLVGVLGYYRTVTLDQSLLAVRVALQQHMGLVRTLAEQFRTELVQQNGLVHAQTEQLRTELAQQNALVQAQTEQLRTMLEAVNFNLHRPLEDQIPLGLPVQSPARR